ncbi:MAG: hypothetical protein PHE55_12460 [Methylococcaceae bacterium]|nr:hypothetical protein [Methylococcaceae bacterium]
MKSKTISIKVWRPVLNTLNTKLDQACLRRDAYLNRVLDVELKELDAEVPLANSARARRFIADQLDKLDRKPVSLSLRPDLVDYLDDICERKNIIRDSFFNRLFFLLAVPVDSFPRYFNLQSDWISFVLTENYDCDSSSPSFRALFDPLNPVIDPFFALRVALQSSDNEKHKGGIYSTTFGSSLFKEIDMRGLNCYMADNDISGDITTLSLDDLLVLESL